jgi:hypothetical protein
MAWLLDRGDEDEASADPARFSEPLREPLSALATASRGPPTTSEVDAIAPDEPNVRKLFTDDEFKIS